MPPACAICGSPLPTVPADTAHPERCPACAARAVGAPGPTSAVAPPPQGGWGAPPPPISAPLVVKVRLLDALLTGIAAAAVGGVAWWAVVALSGSQFPYLALIVGILAGQGVLIGARKGGPLQGALAAGFCLVALVVAEYFVARSLAISQAADAGQHLDVPLWQGFSFAREVVTEAVKADKLVGLFWGIAVIAAAVTAGAPSRRPAIG